MGTDTVNPNGSLTQFLILIDEVSSHKVFPVRKNASFGVKGKLLAYPSSVS